MSVCFVEEGVGRLPAALHEQSCPAQAIYGVLLPVTPVPMYQMMWTAAAGVLDLPIPFQGGPVSGPERPSPYTAVSVEGMPQCALHSQALQLGVKLIPLYWGGKNKI